MSEREILAETDNAGGAGQSAFFALMTCFTVIFTISIVVLYINDVRPMSYFIWMTALALILLFEILFINLSGKRSLAILIQIIAYSLNLIWGVTLNYYFFIGRTDTLPHVWWAESLLQLGHVTDIFTVYEPFPLWHILCDSVYMIGGITAPLFQVFFINSGLVYAILGIISIYILVKKLAGDERMALMSALFLSFNTTFVFYGMYSIARSVDMILFILLMILLIDHGERVKRWLAYGLSFAIIVYHTVSCLFILVVLGFTYVIQKIFVKTKQNPIVTFGFIIIFTGMIALYWAVNATNIIWTITGSLLQSSSGASGLQTGSINDTPLTEVFNYSQYSIVILFIFIGALFILRERSSDIKLKIFAILSLVLIPLSYPGPLLLMNTLSSTASIGRFEEYAFMFMVIISAAGFILLYRKKNKVINALIIVLFVAMVFLSLTSDFVASDNPLVKRPFYTDYLHEAEIIGMDNVANFTDGNVMTDYVAARYLDSSPYQDKMHILEADPVNENLLTGDSSDTIVIRDGELDIRPIKAYTTIKGFIMNPSWNALDYYYKGDPVFDSLDKRNKVYSSNYISAYN